MKQPCLSFEFGLRFKEYKLLLFKYSNSGAQTVWRRCVTLCPVCSSAAVCCQAWELDEPPRAVWAKAARLQSDWPAQPKLSVVRRIYDSHTKQLCSLLAHDRFPSLLWELCERTRWRRKMRFEPSPLSLSISLQALAVSGERKHFGVFQSGSVYCKSLRGMVDGGRWMWGGDTISWCSAGCGAGRPKLLN